MQLLLAIRLHQRLELAVGVFFVGLGLRISKLSRPDKCFLKVALLHLVRLDGE